MKISNWFRKKFLNYEKKEIRNGFTQKCIKCNKVFKEGDYFLSAKRLSFVDKLFPYHMINRFENSIFELTEFKNNKISEKL